MMQKVRTFAELVKFEHTIFALPFAYVGAFVAARGWPRPEHLLWITVAMVGARTAAMGLNRLIDRAVDAANPRTAARHLPRGEVSVSEVLALSVLSFAVLLLAAWQLNPLCLALFPVVVAVLVIYSYTKRFTWLCHLWLGFALAWAPFGAWIAVTGQVQFGAVLLGVAVALWVAGFDVIYATQDIEFDRSHALHSIPARFGLARALLIARLMHLAVVALLLLAWFVLDLGWLYLIGWAGVAILLHYEHSIISPRDMSRLGAAFFNVNGYISLLYFVFTAAATVVAH